MPDWSASMQQTFEYYTVDPGTWKDVKRLDNVKKCTINRDGEADTLGSATIDVNDSVGEAYIRAYLITIQNGVKERHPLGTFLVQTPSSSFNGRVRDVSMDAYTPLLELKENPPPIGYFVAKKTGIMDKAYELVRNHVRAPVIRVPVIQEPDDNDPNNIKDNLDKKIYNDFIAEPEDTWLSFTRDFIANAEYEFGLDELGQVLFLPKQEITSLQPVFTFDDGNSSILHADFNMQHDLYGVPNVVEVIYSTSSITGEYIKDIYEARVVNDDPNSPISTVNRGREITHRVQNPNMVGESTEYQIHEYAIKLLEELSTLEYTITFTHGYYPVRLGDCIRLNYSRAGITDVKAKIISQSIKCVPGCPVTTTAKFTTKLWG